MISKPRSLSTREQSQLDFSANEQKVGTIDQLRQEAAHCRRCHLWEHATQTVFGAGPADAKMMLVGEQPGDQGILPARLSSAI